jgi:hypothetical protein
MTDTPIASYTFLPFARQGLGGRLQEADQAVVSGIRASIPLTLRINADLIDGSASSQDVPKTIHLYGPGDIIGIDRDAIVRSEPRHLVTNFETNYLPFVEFYEEDFPWRYTPSSSFAAGRRMRPWLTLLVLSEDEFADHVMASIGPLPVIEVLNPAVFPTFDTLWAWAHVHVNAALGGDHANHDQNATRLAAIVSDNRDRAYSRLLSPRILRPNTAYHAFLVPSFESGRLAGLRKNPDGAAFPTQGAWVAGRTDTEPSLYPVYHRWFFRTGEVGDFEYLVRLLEPRTVDPQVGRRPIDVLSPGVNLPPITELGGILRLGGALRAPLVTLSDDDLAEYWTFENWAEPYPHAFQVGMAGLVNLAADYTDQKPADANAGSGVAEIAGDRDPLIVPPLYGRWHAQVSRNDPARADPALRHWVDELGLDPRHRVAAGLGTNVVQKNQEPYMEAAWQQVGKVLEGNARIRYAHMAMLASLVWHRHRLGKVAAASDDRILTMTAPVHRRVLADGKTIGFTMRHSLVPPALVGTTVRKVLRPRARIAQLGGFTEMRATTGLVARVNAGKVSAAPPKAVPSNLPTGPAIADALGGGATASGGWLPARIRDLLHRVPSWRGWLLALSIALALLCVLVPVVGVLLAVIVVIGGFLLRRWLDAQLARPPGGVAGAATVVDGESRTPASVDELPTSSSFTITPPSSTSETLPPPPAAVAGPDTATARRFKEALRNTYAVDVTERAIPAVERSPLDLTVIRTSVFAGIDPLATIPKHVRAGVDIPIRIADQLVEDFGEVMVYPQIDDPMYAPLTDTSSEYLLPNIQLLAMNSITLLETNQKFIEAYMVGLNHEFARELLWREYPTDQRGSYFRQFWDVASFLTAPGADAAALRERLFDVPELHRWSRNSGLDEHDNREAQGDKENELVLAIRGELLKKYPTAVVYAHRAAWERHQGAIDRSRPRRLADLPAGIPPTSLVKTPLYEAKVQPDIYFFGFDLTAEAARGGAMVDGEEDPGWFFVIKERPGEPRFGLDLPHDGVHGAIASWNELSWTDVVDDYDAAEQLPVAQHDVTLATAGIDPTQQAQHDEDAPYRWRADTDAAELAYILYQLPVMMAVHAAEMLEKGGG